jgi:hypothetical protein
VRSFADAPRDANRSRRTVAFGDTDASMIARAELQQMFEDIAENAGWDMSKPMLWGYFFTHTSRDELEVAARTLAKEGYRVVEIAEDDDEPLFWLHVERVEAHSVDSLYERNESFYRLAEELGLESYDGMDVGLAPPPN